jgi:hypothetical protein
VELGSDGTQCGWIAVVNDNQTAGASPITAAVALPAMPRMQARNGARFLVAK